MDESSNVVQEKTMSVHHDLAGHYFRDSLDFGVRFDLLWESGALMHKMGRTKSFIDLLMGCECALKAHGVLSHLEDDPVNIYRVLRKKGHRIDRLAAYAGLLMDRTDYDALGIALGEFPVQLRYSLDAYGAFFPWYLDRGEMDLDYSATIGNNQWVLSLRARHARLNETLSQELTGFVSHDFSKIVAHEQEMRQFVARAIASNG